MGLFSSKTKIYVSSVAYNLAGDLRDRPNFLTTTVTRNVLRNSTAISLGEEIVKSQLSGPTMDQRAFFRWARDNYDLGRMEGGIFNLGEVDPADVEPLISVPDGQILGLQQVFADGGELTYFAERHILNNSPERFETEWIADYDDDTEEMVITYADLSTERVSIPDYDPRRQYVIVYYTLTEPGEPDDPLTPDVDESTPDIVTQHILIYEIGSGNPALDNVVSTEEPIDEFFPIIPLRLDNRAIDHPSFADDFPEYERAYKKAIKQPIEDILENIEDNESIDDIDYAFLVHGVEINTLEQVGLRYIYEFIRNLIPYQDVAPETFALWRANTERTIPGSSYFRVRTDNSNQYDVRIAWLNIEESFEGRLGKPGAQAGEIWFEVNDDVEIEGTTVTDDDRERVIGGGQVNHVTLKWQYSGSAYRKLEIYGMTHLNYVYKGKTVETTAKDGIEDGDTSGFIFPLHYPTLRELPIVSANQLSISNRLVVFNCYEEVKQRWYESFLFRILVVVVIGAVSGLLNPGSIGLLGSNAAVGASLGLSGTTAAIAGGIANALAAMIVSMVIQTITTELFGDSLIGSILGSIVAFVAFQATANFMQTGSFSLNWGNMMRADNLLKLTNSVAGGVKRWAAGEIEDLNEEFQDIQEDYKRQMREIEKRTMEVLGYSGTVIDPLMFIQAGNSTDAESRRIFLDRTLLTGSEIADLSLTMISSFTEMTLDLSNPYVTE